MSDQDVPPASSLPQDNQGRSPENLAEVRQGATQASNVEPSRPLQRPESNGIGLAEEHFSHNQPTLLLNQEGMTEMHPAEVEEVATLLECLLTVPRDLVLTQQNIDVILDLLSDLAEP